MNDDLLPEFLSEGRELTQQAARDLELLSRGPDRTALDRGFRAVHTLKGSAGLFGLEPMVRLLHVAEDVLGEMRGGAAVDAAVIAVLVEIIDQVDHWFDDLAATGALPDQAAADGGRLAARLGGAAPQAAFAATAHTGRLRIRYVPRPDCYFAGDDPMAIIAAVPDLVDLTIAPREPFGDLGAYDPFVCNLVLEAVSTAERARVEEALRLVSDQVELTPLALADAPAEQAQAETHAVRTIRVEAGRVDRLADLTGELVVAKGGLADLAAQAEALADGYALAQALRAQQARIDRLVADLHGTVGRIRLTPMAPLLGRFPRLVREVARSLGKSADFRVEGGDIEVDKAVIDGLYEPLLHVLRNALDHGIEAPLARRAAGKPEAGALRLSARAEGEQVVVEVADDGAGIDPDRLRALAVARGLITTAAAAALDPQAALDLIFLPGFSTAANVSDLSGRGVGMDAVRSAVSRLGGRVQVSSALGRGSTVRFVLPITMVLTKVMVVACGGERYGLAIDGVVETTRVPLDRLTNVRDGQAFVLRDRVVPLLRLADLVGGSAAALVEKAQVLRVVVVRAGEEWVGLAVDAFVDRLDAALRPMSGLLANAPGVVGSTLTADGAVLMVLDPAELIG